MKKVLLVVNFDWFFLMHIFPIINSLKIDNKEVYILTNNSGKKEEIQSHGFNFLNLHLDRKRADPITELKTFLNIYGL